MNELRDRLRSLPGFPSDLPVLDADAVPEDPDELFGRWLEEEIAAGARQPSAGVDGVLLARVRPPGADLR